MGNDAETIRALLVAGADALRRAADLNAAGIASAAKEIGDRLLAGGTAFVFGNGGSAGDAEHMAAELLGRFARERRPLAAHALSSDASTITAIANDSGFDEIFARQIRALASSPDVCIGISTSGESVNVVKGLQAGKEAGALTVALTGREGGSLAAASDIRIVIAEQNTARIQEVHRAVIHAICELIEARL